jgi:sugar lactone lactonase YvrE
MAPLPELIGAIETQDILGEGPLWNEADQRIWWTDIHACRLLRADPATGAFDVIAVPERVSSFAFLEGDARRILAAFASGLGLFDLHTGAVTWIARPEPAGSGRRFNDGRVDRHGRFWVASMVEDAPVAGAGSAALYCLDAQGGFSRAMGDVDIGNGLCVSPDGRTLYFADSTRQSIHAYDLDAASGALSGRRLFAAVTDGFPDGAAVDEAGHVWSARWGAGAVVRHAPDGGVAQTLQVPVSQPSCVAFGGPARRLMFVTTARENLSPARLAEEKLAGALLIYQSPVAGLPERRYDASWTRLSPPEE